MRAGGCERRRRSSSRRPLGVGPRGCGDRMEANDQCQGSRAVTEPASSFVIMAKWSFHGLYRNDSGRRLVAGRGRRWLAGWAGHGWSGGQGGQGGVGEVAGGEGFEQVVDGGGEAPFGGCFGFAADRELAEAHVVFDVAVRGFGDVAALAVGGDAFGGGQPGGHRRGGLAAGRRGGGGGAGGGCFHVPGGAGGGP